jgi:hypothetical protein
LKVYGRFLEELRLLMIGFDRGREHRAISKKKMTKEGKRKKRR